MERLSLILILSVIMNFSVCKEVCDQFYPSPLKGKIEEFFGVYQPGNWWVYENQTGTRVDSIYLTQFSDEWLPENSIGCPNNQVRTFIMNSQYLTSNSEIYFTYESYSGVAINFRPSRQFPEFRYMVKEDSIWMPDTFENDNNNILLDSVKLNGTVYHNILIGKEDSRTYFIGRGKGIVGWTYALDTFNLKRFKIF